MTAVSTRAALRDTLADHFVMWHSREVVDGSLGEWRCACGKKFGFSDSAIDHQADALSGAVVDAATLAADETLVEQLNESQWDVDLSDVGWVGNRRDVIRVLRALAAALSERA